MSAAAALLLLALSPASPASEPAFVVVDKTTPTFVVTNKTTRPACVCGTTCACKPGVCPSGCPLAAQSHDGHMTVTRPAPAVQVGAVSTPAPACQWVPAKYDRYGRVTEWKQVCPLKR